MVNSSDRAAEPSRPERAQSFGAIARDYDRFRPGPVREEVEWLLPTRADRVVDLGAGTGAVSRLLVSLGRVTHVVAVEPDDRMREVLHERVPKAQVLAGTGEAIPIGEGEADAVLASSSWHWMDPGATVTEVARVLRPGGVLGVFWSGADWSSSWIREVRAEAIASVLREDDIDIPRPSNVSHVLVIPDRAPFAEPERHEIHWATRMMADDIVGMLGTFSGLILLGEERRAEVLRFAREHLEEVVVLGDDGAAEVPFRAVCWRAERF